MWWQKLLRCSFMLCLEVGNLLVFNISFSVSLIYIIFLVDVIISMIDYLILLNSIDGKYVLTGGEDDLVQVWSMEDRKVVAWGEGHNSWVSFLSNYRLISFSHDSPSFQYLLFMLLAGQWCGF